MARRYVPVLIIITLFLVTGIASAAGTPAWWDNPDGYTGWYQQVSEGTAANTGSQTQVISVIFDVPNLCPPGTDSKLVWQQIEWTVDSGTATLANGLSQRPIEWGIDECPASTSDAYNALAAGYMDDNDSFIPTHQDPDTTSTYVNGRERSKTITSASGGWSPKCERIYTGFQVDADSALSYRLEAQSLCFGPNAVGLRQLSAAASTRLPFLAGIVGILALTPVAFIARRRLH